MPATLEDLDGDGDWDLADVALFQNNVVLYNGKVGYKACTQTGSVEYLPVYCDWYGP